MILKKRKVKWTAYLMQLEINEVSENSNETQDMGTDEASNKIQK